MTKTLIKLYISNKIIFACEQYFSLLTLLESHEIYIIENNCREGFCGICRTTIRQGKVKYINKPIAYINKDEILPCCCKALGSIVLDV